MFLIPIISLILQIPPLVLGKDDFVLIDSIKMLGAWIGHAWGRSEEFTKGRKVTN